MFLLVDRPQNVSRWMVVLLFTLSLTSLTFAQEANDDLSPTAIELTAFEGNPVLLPGEDGAWDAVSIRFPYVFNYEDVHYLFYATFQDMSTPSAIGYATSEDGIEWTKFDSNPILEGDGDGFDAFGMTRPVPFVQEDGTWVIYYNGIPEEGIVFGAAIGRATAPSLDGPWTREENPVLEIGGADAWDTRFLFPDSVLKTEDEYRLYYSSGLRMGLATSEDGIEWTKYDDPETDGRFEESDPIFEPSASGNWDSFIAWGGNVQQTEAGWEMFYYGTASNEADIALGYAYSSDGIEWTKTVDNPILNVAPRSILFPTFTATGNTYTVYFGAAGLRSAGSSYTDVWRATGTIER